jgi:hypothetical protein
MPVEEKLADMRYIRNVDREKMIDRGEIIDISPKVVKVEKKEEETYVSPALQEMQRKMNSPPPPKTEKTVLKPKKVATPSKPKSIAPKQKQPYQPPPESSSRPLYQSVELSNNEQKNIKEKILNTEVPPGYKRQNLILGYNLYGAVIKQMNVFGKNIQETEWDKVTNLPKDTIEIDAHKIRVYFDQEKGIVEAIEILKSDDMELSPLPKRPNSKKKESKTSTPKKQVEKVDIPDTNELINYNSWTVKELKSYCSTHSIDLPSNARKADIIRAIKEFNNGSAKGKDINSRRRELPEIPSKTT